MGKESPAHVAFDHHCSSQFDSGCGVVSCVFLPRSEVPVPVSDALEHPFRRLHTGANFLRTPFLYSFSMWLLSWLRRVSKLPVYDLVPHPISFHTISIQGMRHSFYVQHGKREPPIHVCQFLISSSTRCKRSTSYIF